MNACGASGCLRRRRHRSSNASALGSTRVDKPLRSVTAPDHGDLAANFSVRELGGMDIYVPFAFEQVGKGVWLENHGSLDRAHAAVTGQRQCDIGVLVLGGRTVEVGSGHRTS